MNQSRVFGLAAIAVSLLILIVFAVSRFIRPILPAEINDTLLLLSASVVGVLGVLASLNETVELIDKLRKRVARIRSVGSRTQQLPARGSKVATNDKSSEAVILVVDDDLSTKSELFEQMEHVFTGRAKLQLICDPKEACDALSHQSNILGCITDIVFRNYSSLGGVQVAQTAILNNVRVVVFTGHKRENIKLAIDELKRIGVPKERVLTKPVTFKQYQQFLEQIKGWIIGFDIQ